MIHPLGRDSEYLRMLREEHEAMKSNGTDSRETLATNNLATLEKYLQGPGRDCPYADLLRVIADCLDHIGNRHDMYMVLGSTRSLDSFTLNWKGDGAPGAVYAQDLIGLSMNCSDLL